MERREPYFGPGTPPPHTPEERSRVAVSVLIAAVAVLAALAAAYFLWPHEGTRPPAQSPAPAPSAPPVDPAPRHPMTAQPGEQPLPALKESDGPVAAALAALVGQDAFGRVFLAESLVRNIVATIDNLPRESVSRRLSPLQAVPGLPATQGKGADLALAPANASRYALQMQLVDSVGTDSLVAFYRRHYPLFQQAYVELGYPNGHFNDRVVEAIDDLLATPDPAGPIRLVQPKVLYEYADPSLEERSAGEKMMLRIGKDHRDRVKAKLREIRGKIATP